MITTISQLPDEILAEMAEYVRSYSFRDEGQHLNKVIPATIGGAVTRKWWQHAEKADESPAGHTRWCTPGRWCCHTTSCQHVNMALQLRRWRHGR